MSQENIELVIRGYRAFLAGDLEAISELLDPDVEWIGLDYDSLEVDDRENALSVLAERLEDGYRIVLEHCVDVGDQVVVSFRASGEETLEGYAEPARRYFTIGRYSAVVTIHDGRVVRIQDYPHRAAALDAVGLSLD